MLTGKSLLHVNQGLGKEFAPGELKGYFNDLTEKVTKDLTTLNNKSLPTTKNEKGDDIVFATAIFQYGLGCFDLYLSTNEQKYIDQFYLCVSWALLNQDNNGGWDISAFAGNNSPYGSMALAEGASLLVRAFSISKDEIYYKAAKRAIDLMLLPLSEGGTSLYLDGDLYLMEFMDLPCVLNGWIFSIFGLYDLLLTSEEQKYRNAYESTLNTLKRHIFDFDNGYWSKYDNKKMIASPFYHKLHIAQLSALVLIDNCDEFKQFLFLLQKYQKSWFKRKRAFITKAFQKVFER